MKKLLFVILLLSFLVNAAAQGTGGAALQVTSHTVIPDVIYPGTVGQLQISILNSGTDTAGATVVNYKTPGETLYSEQSVGDIGAGSNAIVSIPFTVPAKTPSGFFVMDLNIVYFADAPHSSIKNTPISIPIVVSQQQILEVKTISVEPGTIQPGDTITAQLNIINTGGVMNNVVIATPAGSSFTLQGTTQQAVGSIPFNSSKDVSVILASSSSTSVGKYSIPLIISYQDSLQNTLNQTIYVGPITVSESGAQFRISLIPVTNTEVGSQAQFDLTLENLGGSGASVTIDLNQTAEFTPIGSTRVYFDSIGPGAKQSQKITIGIAPTTNTGYYNLPITVSISGKTYAQSIGIVVNATPDIAITSDSTPQFISAGSNGVKVLAQISNVGNGPIRSVYVSATPTKDFTFVGPTDKFIGTLNVDDFATFQIAVDVPSSLAPAEYGIPLAITFKDSRNMEHTINKDVTVRVYSGLDASRLNSISGSTTAGGNRTNGSVLFGLSAIQLAAAVLIIGVVGYFVYKKYKGNKK